MILKLNVVRRMILKLCVVGRMIFKLCVVGRMILKLNVVGRMIFKLKCCRKNDFKTLCCRNNSFIVLLSRLYSDVDHVINAERFVRMCAILSLKTKLEVKQNGRWTYIIYCYSVHVNPTLVCQVYSSQIVFLLIHVVLFKCCDKHSRGYLRHSELFSLYKVLFGRSLSDDQILVLICNIFQNEEVKDMRINQQQFNRVRKRYV